METQLPKIIYYSDDDFQLLTQHYEGQLILHCEVTNWTISSLRKGYSVFNALIHEASELGFDRLLTITPNPKFARLFGGEVLSELEYENKKYEVIVWDLKPSQLLQP